MAFGVNAQTGRPGPAPQPPRDGDKVQARQRINVEVRTGYRPHPNQLPCADCGHLWREGEQRHEYDHHKGYSAEQHYAVEPVCTLCHAKRSRARGEARARRNSLADSAPLADLYLTRTLAQIAAETGIPEETVRRRLRLAGVALRRKGEAPRG